LGAARLLLVLNRQETLAVWAVIEPLSLSVQAYAAQLRALLAATQSFDARIAAVFAQHTDRDIFGSFPAPAPSVPRAWSRPSAPTGRAGTPRRSSKRTRASRPSPNGVGKPSGSITGWPARNS
jgi:hypothetical protein